MSSIVVVAGDLIASAVRAVSWLLFSEFCPSSVVICDCIRSGSTSMRVLSDCLVLRAFRVFSLDVSPSC